MNASSTVEVLARGMGWIGKLILGKSGSTIMVFTNAGAPTDGTTGAGEAGPGSLCVDTTNKALYQNVGTKASPIWRAAVSDGGAAAIGVLRIAANVADTETVTIGADVYEWDRAANGVTAGRIALTGHSDDTPTNATPVLVAAINASGTANVKAIQISVNQVLVVSADAPGGNVVASAVTTALAETMAGTNNAWDTANMRGGSTARGGQVCAQTRVPNAQEVALTEMHFIFPFTVAHAVVMARVTATGAINPITDFVLWSGNDVYLDHNGATNFAATDTITVIASS